MPLIAGCSTPKPKLTAQKPAGVSEEQRLYQQARAIKPGYKVGRPYRIAGKWYKPLERFELSQTGIASWYGPGFHGRLTANGERYNMHAMTAAHRTLQMPSVVLVENLDNNKSVIVRVNDRGPYIDGRIIDLSKKAADILGLQKKGLANVRVTVLPDASRELGAMAKRKVNVGAMDDRIAELNADPPQWPLPQPPVRVAKNRPQGTMYLQAAAFSKQNYAERARTLLRGIGPVEIKPFKNGDRTLYRVRVGPYAERQKANAALKRVREVGFEGAHLVARG